MDQPPTGTRSVWRIGEAVAHPRPAALRHDEHGPATPTACSAPAARSSAVEISSLVDRPITVWNRPVGRSPRKRVDYLETLPSRQMGLR
jgi:hypothetical protein